eukprot:SAG11_NODE_16558_length_544_cov_0.806742_1_plen_146_part_01
MASMWGQTRTSTLCVDIERNVHSASSAENHNGALLYTTEMRAGASDEDQYPPFREVGCVVCSVPRGSGIYTRWGSTACNGTGTKLYDGFIAGSHYAHNGGGADWLCMHPEPQFPDGYDDNEQPWSNLLYGTEYEDTGALGGVTWLD